MAISIDLRVLASQLEKDADAILASAEDRPEVFQLVVKAVAAASATLEQTAEALEKSATGDFTPDQLDEIAAVASSFYESEDPLLKKQASVLDELLLTLASPKNALAQARKATEDEINRLREKYHSQRREDCYNMPKESLDKQNLVKEQAAAVDKIKRYKPLEAPLSTRYAPDYPGNMLTRISDNVWQDPLTGKLYDYKAGYTTNKGNQVPGGAVENQIPDVGSSQMDGHTMFSTREAIMSRYANDDGLSLVKQALEEGRLLGPEESTEEEIPIGGPESGGEDREPYIAVVPGPVNFEGGRMNQTQIALLVMVPADASDDQKERFVEQQFEGMFKVNDVFPLDEEIVSMLKEGGVMITPAVEQALGPRGAAGIEAGGFETSEKPIAPRLVGRASKQ